MVVFRRIKNKKFAFGFGFGLDKDKHDINTLLNAVYDKNDFLIFMYYVTLRLKYDHVRNNHYNHLNEMLYEIKMGAQHRKTNT